MMKKEKSLDVTEGLSWGKAFALIPVLVPAGLACFAIASMLLLLLGRFETELVWVSGLIVAIASAIFITKYAKTYNKSNILIDALVIVGVIAWVAINAFFTSQHVFTNRDPATYSTGAAWLTERESLKINKSEVFGDVKGVHFRSAGFSVSKKYKDTIEAQGTHVLPALLGSIGKFVGSNKMFRVMPIFGGIALLAMYGLAKQLVEPPWAAAAALAIASSLPMLYFSRDTYTEPLTMAFVFGGLSLLRLASQNKTYHLWLMSGIIFGAATLTRVDAWLTILGLAIFLAITLALSKKGSTRSTAKSIIWIAAGFLPVSLIGFFDLWLLTGNYYTAHREKLLLQIIAVIAVLAAGLVATYVFSLNRGLLTRLNKSTKPWRGPALATVVLAVSLLLLIRPLRYGAYAPPREKVNHDISAIQQRTGDPVGPRKYGLRSVEWVGWYIGPTLVFLGVAGMAYSIAKYSEGDDEFAAATLLVVGIPTLLYIYQPSITTDQIWAARRFLPLVLPGLAIFGIKIIEHIYNKLIKGQKLDKFYAVFLVAFIVAPIALSSRPFWFVRDTAQLDSVFAYCKSLPADSAVLWLGMGRLEAVMPTRTFCDFPAAGYHNKTNDGNPDSPSKQDLSEVSNSLRSKGFTPIVAVYQSNSELLGKETNSLTHVSTKQYNELERTVRFLPQLVIEKQQPLLFGEITRDGSIKNL